MRVPCNPPEASRKRDNSPCRALMLRNLSRVSVGRRLDASESTRPALSNGLPPHSLLPARPTLLLAYHRNTCRFDQLCVLPMGGCAVWLLDSIGEGGAAGEIGRTRSLPNRIPQRLQTILRPKRRSLPDGLTRHAQSKEPPFRSDRRSSPTQTPRRNCRRRRPLQRPSEASWLPSKSQLWAILPTLLAQAQYWARGPPLAWAKRLP
jgi:hypothetical protein